MHELTVIDSVIIIVWPVIIWEWTNLTVSCIMQVTATACWVHMHELTVIDSVFTVWPIIGWGWTSLTTSCITQVTAIWHMVLLVLTAVWNFPILLQCGSDSLIQVTTKAGSTV